MFLEADNNPKVEPSTGASQEFETIQVYFKIHSNNQCMSNSHNDVGLCEIFAQLNQVFLVPRLK